MSETRKVFELTKGKCDPSTYFSFKLLNDIEVIVMRPNSENIVFDQKESNSTSYCYLTVGAGSFSDTTEGVAHLLEHLILLSGDDNEEIRGFSEHIGLSGGYFNGHTSSEEQSYFFQVPSEKFVESLRSFSTFFQGFDARKASKYLQSEIVAIHGEFEKTKTSNVHILYNTMKFLSQIEEHKRLECGNQDSLQPVTLEEVQNFYDKYYSSNLMKLSIVSTLPFAALKKVIEDRFSTIPNKNLSPLYEKTLAAKPYHSGVLGRMVKIVPKGEANSLSIVFQVPPFCSETCSKSCGFLNSSSVEFIRTLFLLDQPGSALFELKKLKLVKYISADVTNKFQSLSLFTITMSCFPDIIAKNQNIYNILRIIFSYLDFVKQNQKNLLSYYEEVRTLQSAKFNYFDDIGSFGDQLCLAVAKKMKITSVHKSLCSHFSSNAPENIHKDAVFSIGVNRKINFYNLNALLDIISRFEESVVFVMHQSTSGKPNLQTEPLIGAQYIIEELDEVIKLDLKGNNLRSISELYSKESVFTIPGPNPFVVKDFSLLPKGNLERVEHDFSGLEHKVLCKVPFVAHLENLEVHFKRDDLFNHPKTYVKCRFRTKEIINDQDEFDVHVLIMMKMFDEVVSFEKSRAHHAGFSISRFTFPDGFGFKFGGFSQNITKVFDLVFSYLRYIFTQPEKLKDLSRYYELAKDEYFHDLSRKRTATCLAEAHRCFHNIAEEGFSLRKSNKLNSLANMSITSFQSFIHHHFYKHSRAVVLFTGDFNYQVMNEFLSGLTVILGPTLNVDVENLVTEENRSIRSEETSISTTSTKHLHIPSGDEIKIIQISEPPITLSGQVVGFKISVSQEEKSRLSLLAELYELVIKEQFFRKFRTEEKLGYNFSCFASFSEISTANPAIWFKFCFETIVPVSVEDLSEKLDNLLHNVDLKEKFYEAAETVRRKKEQVFSKVTTLSREHEFYWRGLLDERQNAKSLAEESRYLNEFTWEDLDTFAKQFFLPNAPERRKLMVSVLSQRHFDELPAATKVSITDIQALKASLEYV
eukprot:snap_masked-scaffold_5-processed-gene-3.19-mRNA-1 protein AED:1.00 eAED:1.00 QI:0/0/0/0/1/1/2/0/1036